jgi:DNA topoisomerase-6 subunit B
MPPGKAQTKQKQKTGAPADLETAETMAAKQRDISVSEFFAKNRHLLGFDNPRKALLTTIKEAVDNALDACEEAGILPDVDVVVTPVDGREDRFRVVVEDNGPGIVQAQIPKIFAKLLYGSKFHRLRMSRGQQGIGISAAGMYGQLTTGQPVRITSRVSGKKPAHFCEVAIDTQHNRPDILKEEDVDWNGKPRGTRIEIELEAKFQKGKQSVDEYLAQTAIANPHVRIRYVDPTGQETVFERATKKLPEQTKEIKPHPYGVELGVLIKMLRATSSRKISAFLAGDFSRVSPRTAREICQKAGIDPAVAPDRVAVEDADRLLKAIRETKIMAPSTDCISPIGEELILKGLQKEIQADFYTSVTRSPSVYRGNPFQIEIGLAYGGKVQGSADGEEVIEQARVLRFANRVPLLYQQGGCAITKAIVGTDWKGYGLSQPKGALPLGPVVILVHMASVWVPFTSESKEAIAHYPEIVREIKLGLQECGRRLSAFVRKRRRIEDEEKKRSYIQKYIPELVLALKEILKFSDVEAKRTERDLKTVLEKVRGGDLESW